MMAGKEGNMAVIGHRDDVLPFRALGARVFITGSVEEARKIARKCAGDGFPVILVSDDLLAGMEDIIEEYSSMTLPSITALPGPGGEARFSHERLSGLVKKAIGLDIKW